MYNLYLCLDTLQIDDLKLNVSPHFESRNYFRRSSKENLYFSKSFESTWQYAKDNGINESKRLYSLALRRLIPALNSIHGVDGDERYWEIIVGHWLQRYVDTSINRINSISELFDSYRISSVSSYHVKDDSLICISTSHFTSLVNDTQWNLDFYTNLIKQMKPELEDRITFHERNEVQEDLNRLPKKINQESFLRKGLSKVRILLTPFSKALILSSYLPRRLEWALSIRNLAFPQNGKLNLEIEGCKVDKRMREIFSAHLIASEDTGIEKFILGTLVKVFPFHFLESFDEIRQLVNSSFLPKNPRFILTSNDFDSNDFFKIWVADKTRLGVKFIVGQHGNNYGTDRLTIQSIEERTCDSFLTWGWETESSSHIPLFNLRNPRGRQIESNSAGHILLTQLHFPNQYSYWDSVSEFEDYFQSQVDLVSCLDPNLRDKLLLRLHPAHSSFGWDEQHRWNQLFGNLNVETGHSDIRRLLMDSRIVIHGYDSTGLLETLQGNYPSLCFIPYGLEHLTPEARVDYQNLMDVGMIFTSAAELASHLQIIFSDIDGWWNSPTIQLARTDFCKKYSRSSESPYKELSNSILRTLKP